MTWTTYRVAFRLLSPMHIGWRKLGNMQQTRPYVTGRVLWGAYTARLTRELRSRDYEGVGEEVDRQLAFTYFYPAISSDPDKPPDPDKVDLWPWGNSREKDGPEKFSWLFLGSYASTALSDGHSSEEGSLHETEFIAPFVRTRTPNEEPQPIYLIGYIFERQKPASNSKYVVNVRQDMLDDLQIGGERSYGWGRVKVHSAKPLNEDDSKTCFGYKLDCKGNLPEITVPKDGALLAHTEAESLEVKKVENGTLEPLVGRETTSPTTFGKVVSKADICWVPGTTITEEKTFQIQPRGIWKQH